MHQARRQLGTRACVFAAAAASVVCCAARGQAQGQELWLGVAGGSAHGGVSNSIALPHGELPDHAPAVGAWHASVDEQGRTFTAIPSQTPVFDQQHVYVCGRVMMEFGAAWRLLAISRETGSAVWAAAIPPPLVDSFSSAAVDVLRQRVIVASARDVICFDAITGGEMWRRTLTRNVVNASPIVVDDVSGRGRAFVTDYDGFGVAASLYCINLDARSATNPFDPGDLVWRVPIGGASGATPAFLPASEGGVGLVYVATRGEPSFMPGSIIAYDAHADAAPSPAFIINNAIDEGFYGTLSVAPPTADGEAPTLYAVSYEFYGGLNSANLLAVDGASGAIRWSVPSNRGGAAPVLLGNGRIAVSAGVQGFGTLPSVALYLDRGDHGIELWNSVRDSWIDDDGDGLIDPSECDSVGLWSYQPIASGDLKLLCVGIAPESAMLNAFGASIATVDVSLWPMDRLFCRRTFGTSGSPAAGRGWFYSIGANGVAALAMPRIDVNGDGRTTIDDLSALERGEVSLDRRDVNGDGAVSPGDRHELTSQLRVHEASRMTTRRP